MKSMATFALTVLLCVPAKAQFGGMGGMGGRPISQAQSIELELLEMEQTADKAALKEALLLQAQQGMRAEKKLSEKEATDLAAFIAAKKQAIKDRASELTKGGVTSRRVAATPTRPPQTESDKLDVIEKIEKSQIELQLLQAQINLMQSSLTQAINALANAEVVASDDETQKAKAEAARKDYDKIKAKYVELSKRHQMEQWGLQSMQQSTGIYGVGGMGGGMGGGMR